MQTILFITHCTGPRADWELKSVTQLTLITILHKPRGNGVENSQEQRKERLISDTNIHHPPACTHHRNGGWGLSPNLLLLQIGPHP